MPFDMCVCYIEVLNLGLICPEMEVAYGRTKD